MRVLITLTYYRPHYSGLTIYVERLARAMVQRGHQVDILTSRYDHSLPAHEVLNGVEIHRMAVWMRISKGVIMPVLPFHAWQLAQRADVLNLHVPQLDAAPVAILGKWMKKPLVLTYHCDLLLPKGVVHFAANRASHFANRISSNLADVIVTNTRDYAEHSQFLRNYLSKVKIIPPPVEVEQISDDDQEAFRQRTAIKPGQQIIGMAARLATEKGVEYLVDAMPAILARHPQARVLFVGQYEEVVGEETYARKLQPMIKSLGEHWTFLGVLPPIEFAAFLHQADVLVLPSINSTESFGMVQVEAMVCGTPVVASDLPGVRQPVTSTGMGMITPARDTTALADAVIEILNSPNQYIQNITQIKHRYSGQQIALEYESLFAAAIEKKIKKVTSDSGTYT